MKRDNVADPELHGLEALGVIPMTVEDVLRRDFDPS